MKNGLVYMKATMAMLFWALTFVWVKFAFEVYRPLEIVFMRLVLACVILFAVMLISGHWQKIEPKDWGRFMLVAFCEPFLYFMGETNGLQYVSSTLGSLVISVIPLMTALVTWLFLKERITRWLLVGLLVSFAGVAAMSMAAGDFSATFKGLALLSLAVVGGMFYAIFVKRLTHSYSALTVVAWQSFFGMLYFLPLFAIFEGKHFTQVQHSIISLGAVAGMSVFASVGAFLLYTGVIRDLGVVRANIFTNLIPVFTVVLAYFMLGDRLCPLSSIGLALTILGLFLSQYPDLRLLRKRLKA